MIKITSGAFITRWKTTNDRHDTQNSTFARSTSYTATEHTPLDRERIKTTMPHHEDNNFSAPAEIVDFSALLFDMDGTIIDSTPAIVKYWQETGREIGVDGDGMSGSLIQPFVFQKKKKNLRKS